MPVASPARTIDELTKKAARTLGQGRFLQAERLAAQALELARDECEFERMATIVPTLYEARRQQLEAAAETGRMTILETPFTEEEVTIEPACYLVRPPLVGADARRFRLMAFSREVPVAVLCREPLARIGLCPVVALSGGATVRMKVDPPLDPDAPDIDWFLDALEALGEAALEGVDPELEAVKRIDALLARIDAIPAHEGLHAWLEHACLEAHDRLSAEADKPPSARKR
ncbi:MAG: hypothetical protein ACYSU7_07010 [Planctomycetota bacterium]|jgi:hypothetical protein